MIKWWLLPVIWFAFLFKLYADTPVTIRRICINGLNNDIFFTPSSDPCAAYFQYKVWGRPGAVGPFTLIDSILSKNVSQYTHIDANIGGTKNWYYFITIIDSCGPDFETISDTVLVDRTPPEIVIIDSVSIDPLTNTAHIGWHNNHSPDFSYFKLYSATAGINTPIFPFNKDTFFIDTRVGYSPVNDSLRYDLSSVDSCGLETVFGINQHVSMYLRVNPDTCKHQANLSWTPYIGWQSVHYYYIFKKITNGPYVLIDSVKPPQIIYIDTITLGVKYQYYIWATKDTLLSSTSSSNSVTILTRYRAEPINSYVTKVSVDQPLEAQLTIHIYNPLEEVSSYNVLGAPTITGPYSILGSIALASSAVTSYAKSFPFNYQNKYIRVLAENACGDPFPATNISRFSDLSITQQNTQTLISWEPYFTWNVGVDYYRIFRGTADNLGNTIYYQIDSVPGTDSTYIDNKTPSYIGENGLCYFVEAIQNSGDINATIETANSTHKCLIGTPTVFIPNAFNPKGQNKTFRPEGMYIDYTNSRMEIYDRWGQRIVNQQDIRSGWNGLDSGGNICMLGVYFYKIYLKSTNGTENVFVGFVTLLD